MNILVFGNPLLEKDALPLQLLADLRKIFPATQFTEFDTAEDLEQEGPEITVLDTVEGIEKCEIITDFSRFEKTSRGISLHDFDVRETVLLLQKMGLITHATVIAIPPHYNQKKALEETTALIRKLKH